MRSRNFWIGLVSSVLVVVVAVALLLLVRSGDDEVALPDTIGDLVASDTAAAYPGDGPDDEQLQRLRTRDDVNADGYSDALDGAAADSRVYLDPQDPSPISVVAVAADTGPLLPQEGFVDPEELGFALPQAERITRGDVECILLRNQPPRAGTDYQPDQATPDAHYCQQRSGSLTVRVRSTSGDTDAMVDLVGDLWDELD